LVKKQEGGGKKGKLEKIGGPKRPGQAGDRTWERGRDRLEIASHKRLKKEGGTD